MLKSLHSQHLPFFSLSPAHIVPRLSVCPYCCLHLPICPLSLSSSMPWCYSSCSQRSVILSSTTWPVLSWLMTWTSWMTPVSSPEGQCFNVPCVGSQYHYQLNIFVFKYLNVFVTYNYIYSGKLLCTLYETSTGLCSVSVPPETKSPTIDRDRWLNLCVQVTPPIRLSTD